MRFRGYRRGVKGDRRWNRWRRIDKENMEEEEKKRNGWRKGELGYKDYKSDWRRWWSEECI